ncbi:cobalamin-binding protein [Rhodoblastus sphagnicola]|uniref:Cobalamin-binding protein n=1 Tax=Rhodoblastus sphagnicola TaxID=333368 RepID=A0A2S6MTZ6_9HYPH|nr:corrinoid protein [Rhodoblastus sphagnicola]MBB4199767.1 corrinoid protein of di/trimethylamine methyltransferase [Rhodoblastus sphagnicola]PPQ25828.1 cobalamin-binding protein [Rhodoblastus sphagnicola]
MSADQEELFERLATAVFELDEALAAKLSQEVLDRGYDAWNAVEHGLLAGVNRAGKLFDEEEYFVPELLIAADAMYAGLAILRPHIKGHDSGFNRKVVIGVVQGDTHDIGKNLVRIMLEVAGFEVHDLGRDVPPRKFVEAAIALKADVIALSTLMTTTMERMGEVVSILEAEQVRNRFKVIVGGSPLSQQFSDRIGADGYAPKAAQAVELTKRLVGLVNAA